MRKYVLLTMSLIILILSFLNSWFGDYLIDALTSFIYPFLIIIPLFICYIVCLILSIIALIKNHKSVLNFLSIIILIITTLLILFFPFRMAKTKLELSLYESERNAIIEMIVKGELKADDIGNVKLPNKYKKTSTSGEVALYQKNEEGIVVAFWVFRGMLSGSVQLIYSTGGEQLIKDNETGHPIVSIKKLKNNWYYVITDY